MEKNGQRTIGEDPTLLKLIGGISEQKDEDGVLKYEVDKNNSKSIGLFTYTKNGVKKTSKIFIVRVKDNKTGKVKSFIFAVEEDRTNYIIAQQTEEAETSVIVMEDIELNEERLKKQIERANENQKIRETGTAATGNGSSPGGEGRDLPAEEKEKAKEETQKNENQIQTIDGKPAGKLENLKEINLSNSPKIRLDTLINGYFLWEILQIENPEYKNRLPEGLNVTAFRNGYLSIVDSAELEARDGKKRSQKETFVISTYSGETVELDNLTPKKMGTLQQQKESQQSDIKYADGEMINGPDTDMTLTRTSLYEIPGVHERFNNGENWYLAVEYNKGYIENAKIPTKSKKQEIVFGQLSRDTSSDYYKNEIVGGDGTKSNPGAIWTKLESIEEPVQTKNENKQEEGLVRAVPNESLVVREQLVNEIAEECLKNSHVEGVYDEKEIKTMARKYLGTTNKTKGEIIQTIVENAEREHPLPGTTPWGIN